MPHQRKRQARKRKFVCIDCRHVVHLMPFIVQSKRRKCSKCGGALLKPSELPDRS